MKKINENDVKERGKFAVILKCLLAKNNIKQNELAKALGMSTATVTNYIKGKSTPTQQVLEKIASFLNVSPQAFYDDVNIYMPYLNMNEKKFVEKFRSLLSNSGISQENLAKEIGVSRQTVNYYFNGRMMPTNVIMDNICDFFNVPPSYFTEGNDNDKKDIKNMKIVVKEMPNSHGECLFKDYTLCQFGGQCDLKNGECKHLIALGDANSGVYLTSTDIGMLSTTPTTAKIPNY